MNITSEFIKQLFNKSKIDDKYLKVLITPKALSTYKVAFTSNTVNSENNYELYEYIGDTAANTAVVMYFFNTFPQLQNVKYINILNRLKIVHVSKDSYSKIAENLGFWSHIKYDANVAMEKPLLKKNRDALLEDVFEAFIGATYIILLEEFKMVGVSSQIIYNFIKEIFDKKEISFAPEDLYDPKTRLKELFEVKKNVSNPLVERFGRPRYTDAPQPATSTVLTFTNDSKLKFFGSGNSKQHSHKIAAQQAIDFFDRNGYNTEKKFNLMCS